MTDSFDRAEDLFHDALELSVMARAEFLRAHCGGDAGLEARVARLLELHDGADAALPLPPTQQVLAPVEDPVPAEHLVGQALGPFRLIRLLGAGGMGTVYLAEQEHPRRQVALKVLRVGQISPDAHRRFVFEVNVLAALDHPGIARLLEAGVGETARGPLRYLAMEFVAGRTFRSTLDDDSLDVTTRLTLMADLCDAIAHAHGRGIVHRDLKPENVMIGEERDASGVTRLRPRVLDFGIAKSLGVAVIGRTQATMTGQILGTVDYMSPEQIGGRADSIDARSDVYSLGVMLYQLVTGHMPYDLRNSPFTEAARIILYEEPVAAGKLNRALRGDVETVAGKALAKEPTYRYRDARELEQDLRRILRGEPITARPPSPIAKVRKWIARNRVVATLVAALVTAIVGGLVVSTTLWLTTASAREEAATRAAESEETVRFLESIFEQASPTHETRGRTPVRDVVAQATRRVTSELGSHPTLRARILAKLGRVNDWVENSARGVELLREAIALRGDTAVDDEVCRWRLALGTALHNADRLEDAASELGSLVLELRRRKAPPDLVGQAVASYGWVLERLGHYAKAEPLLLEALATQRRMGDLGDAHDLIEALNCNASLLSDTHRNAEALPLFEECAQRCEQSGARGQMRLPYVLNNLARCEIALRRMAPAESHVERGLELARQWFGENHPALGALLSTRGELHSAAGRYAESISAHREALALRERVFGAHSGEIAWSLNDLACALVDAGQSTEAATHLERALAIFETARGVDGTRAASCRNNLAVALARTGSAVRAEALARQSLEVCSRQELGPRTEAGAWHALAVALEASSRFDDAMVAMDHAIGLRESLPDAAWLRGNSRQLRAYYANRRGQHADAEAFARAAIDDLKASDTGDSEPLANAIYQRGWAEWRQGRVQDALTTLRESIDHYRRAAPQGSWLMTYALGLLGNLLVAGGSIDGLPHLEEACRIRETLAPNHIEAAEMFETLGRARMKLGLREDAASPLLHAHEILRKTLAADDARVRRVRGELRELYEAMGRPDDAAAWR